jgi:histidinol-phosphatase
VTPDLRLALELADLADTMTLERFGTTDLRVETKPDHSPVTEVDRRVEEELRHRILQARPSTGRATTFAAFRSGPR